MMKSPATRSLSNMSQAGFTLIELVIVIVIIGILAAVAIPNFSDVSDDAKKAKASGIAGSFASWAGTNYARCQGKLTGATVSVSCANANKAMFATAGLDVSTVTSSGTDAACVFTIDGAEASAVSIKATGTTC
jgi:prepilin-type N-terminal cleavage/methylation domain-containing protein